MDMDSTLPPEQPQADLQVGLAGAIPPVNPTSNTPKHERHSIAEMIGEFMREAAVLVFVFIPLDLVIEQRELTIWWILAIVVLPAFFLATGIVIERKRTT